MIDWRGLMLPGAVTVIVLTVLAMLFGTPRIEHDVSSRLGQALAADHGWADHRVTGRTVTLMGMAPSEDARDGAQDLALSVHGVRHVVNQAGLPPLVEPFTFSVRKGADGIALTGHVPDTDLAETLVAHAETANPGIAVVDETVLGRGAPEGFAAIARFGVAQLANMTGGEAQLSGTGYAISGTAADPMAYEAELARLEAELPAQAELVRIDIAPPVADPFSFVVARSKDGAVRLGGHAPSFEARDALVAAAAALAGESSVDNQLVIADGAPEDFAAAAQAAIEHLGALREGAAQLSGVAVSLTGIVADEAARRAVEQALRAALADHFEIEFALAVPDPASEDVAQ